MYPWPGQLCSTYPPPGRPLPGVFWVGPRGGGVASGVSDQSHPRCCCHGLCCPVPARPCSFSGPFVPLAHEVAVFGSCRSVPAWRVVCGVHPPAPDRVCWNTFACLPGPPSMRGCSAYGPCPVLPRSACLRLILFCTCLPLCAGALWQMPGWVWRDVRSLFLFFTRIWLVTYVHL